jgi:transposase
LHAAERDQPDVQAERAAFQAEVAALDPERLVFVDESGVLTNMVRLYARAPEGQRAQGSAPAGRWQRLTVLGALGCKGVAAAMTIAAATDTAIFLAFIDKVLIPELRQSRPDAIVIMDNLSAHKAPAVRQHLEAAGLRLLYLPRYSPDLSPIEPMWSKLKTSLRAVAARSLQALEAALPQALNRITPNDATGYFRHCGYAK